MDPNIHNANLAGFSVEDKYNYLHRLLFVITVTHLEQSFFQFCENDKSEHKVQSGLLVSPEYVFYEAHKIFNVLSVHSDGGMK